ncbi:MAG TPA: hypothetical protein PLM71_07220, partial [Syntrophorhabdaceae bacterium]|nr:hypothetical protein [Syntrophorhabdaceae bacterium]
MTTRAWDITTPADTDFIGEGDDALRNLKVDIKERIEIDHWFDNVTDPNQGNCDGYHKKVTLLAQETAPANVVGAGLVYTKVVDGVVELFYKDDAGTENQLTENGVIKLNTLQNDINGNWKNITNLGTVQGNTVQGNTVQGNVVNAGELQIGNSAISTWRDYTFLWYRNPNSYKSGVKNDFYFNFTLRGFSQLRFEISKRDTGDTDHVEFYFHGTSIKIGSVLGTTFFTTFLLPSNYTIKASL